ncbi:MAG: cell division protein ZapB [Treponema sp.]|nr:cell division protein ZapB [Treponema sp.]
MISVDTILLLQQKVESAVQKIEQLKAENDALRAERSELTKALSEKTELLSRFSADEKKIEDGILGALTRLDAVENALLDGSQAPLADSDGSSTAPSAAQSAPETTSPAPEQAAPEQAAPAQATQIAEAAPAQTEAPSAPAEPQEDNDGLFGDDSFETQEEGVPDIF